MTSAFCPQVFSFLYQTNTYICCLLIAIWVWKSLNPSKSSIFFLLFHFSFGNTFSRLSLNIYVHPFLSSSSLSSPLTFTLFVIFLSFCRMYFFYILSISIIHSSLALCLFHRLFKNCSFSALDGFVRPLPTGLIHLWLSWRLSITHTCSCVSYFYIICNSTPHIHDN